MTIKENTWLNDPISGLNNLALNEAKLRQSQLTKPLGSLGKLEHIAEWMAACQNKSIPSIKNIGVRVFASDHGVAAQGVSAFPQAVTAQMIHNFCAGGAAVTVLSKQFNADFKVINLGCLSPIPASSNLINNLIAKGTADFTQAPAMTEQQLSKALSAGRDQITENNFDIFVGGEMGIANTTSASAILAALYTLPAADICGRGTGIDDSTLERKQDVINRALALHAENLNGPLGILACLGGFEIAALTGAYIACAQQGTPILIDGFISTAAACLAVAIAPACREWMLFAHKSKEQGHAIALEHLKAVPLLDLNMRLGEGSGAILAIGLIQSALTLHKNMATFAEAGVNDGQ